MFFSLYFSVLSSTVFPPLEEMISLRLYYLSYISIRLYMLPLVHLLFIYPSSVFCLISH